MRGRVTDLEVVEDLELRGRYVGGDAQQLDEELLVAQAVHALEEAVERLVRLPRGQHSSEVKVAAQGIGPCSVSSQLCLWSCSHQSGFVHHGRTHTVPSRV